MIPVRLELTNFLSYCETAVLDFDGVHLAGISGPNGAGKSSIMEAMTWALFGQSRVRSDDDLVNRLAGDDGAAEVRFTFSLEGLSYRVIRRKRPGKTTLLELQMDAGDGAWKPLSEGKLRHTQEAIENLLRMNYDTFTNASFLLQGKADQFTTRTASQRKEILAELLGVTEWERYREQAAAARKEVVGNIALLDGRLEEKAKELEEETERRKGMDDAAVQHQIIVEKRELKELLLKETRLKEAALEQQRKSIAELQEREDRLQVNLRQARETLQDQQNEGEQYSGVVARSEEILIAYETWQAADKEEQQHQALFAKHSDISQAMQPYRLELARMQSRLEEQQQALRLRANRVEAAHTEKNAVEKRIKESEEKLESLRKESKQLSELQEALHKAREILQLTSGQRNLWRQELNRLEEKSQRMDVLANEKSAVRKTRDEAQTLIESLDDKIAVIAEQKQIFMVLQAEQQTLLAQQPALRTGMEQLKQRIKTLETAEEGGTCPLCDQPLSEEHRHTVLETMRADGKQNGDSYRANKTRLQALQVELPQVEKTINQGQRLEREQQAQQPRLAKAEARLEEIAKIEADWSSGGEKRLVELAASLADESLFKTQSDRVTELTNSLNEKKTTLDELQELQSQIAGDKANLNEIERLLSDWEREGKAELARVDEQLKENSFSKEARKELARLREQMESVGYDPIAHQTTVQEKKKVINAPDNFHELQKAQAALKQLQKAIDGSRKQIAQHQADLKEQQRQVAKAREQLAILETDRININELQGEVNQLRNEEISAAQQLALAQQRLNVLDDVRSLRKELQAQRESQSLRVRRLSLLEKSCGRKGVQALLIEHALPEIEESANLLLERLTGGEMSIKFDTQRRLKSRDALTETLDIIISDRAGERPYDNYSGGEQFRINFAIRLALSQLLANRAGARLQTLVVDEGFGSQDPQGRQRLVEAINAVQDDFACVLVITHIDELREAFPTRIEVLKEPNGSQITVY